jgi:hypothetical protein
VVVVFQIACDARLSKNDVVVKTCILLVNKLIYGEGSGVGLTEAPEFTEVDANGVEFRQALVVAGGILTSGGASLDFSVYSRHCHAKVPVEAGEVLFEELVGSDEISLYPLGEREAAERGLPSCWGFAPGEGGRAVTVVLRYADKRLHERGGIDVTSEQFRVRLAKIADAFVAAGIHRVLELNVAGRLFPAPEGYLTREDTVGIRRQRLTFDVPLLALVDGDWSQAACWSFLFQGEAGEAVVKGMS